MATRAKKPPLRKREQANVRTVSRQAVNSMAFQESRRSAASLARAKSGRGEPRERTRKRKGWNRVSEEKRVVVGRSHLVGKRVITLNSAQDLGEVAQLWVDPEEWTVVALSIRTSFLFGALDHLPISSLQQIGDVLLVPEKGAESLEFTPYGYQRLVGADVVTETGEFLGKARDYEFSPDDGVIARMHFDAFGLPSVPGSFVSTYALPVKEVVASSTERIIVKAGAEARAKQLTMSFLQRLSLADPPWEAGKALPREPEYEYAPWQQAYSPPQGAPPSRGGGEQPRPPEKPLRRRVTRREYRPVDGEELPTYDDWLRTGDNQRRQVEYASGGAIEGPKGFDRDEDML